MSEHVQNDGPVVAILMTSGAQKSKVQYRVGLLPSASALDKGADHPGPTAPKFNRAAALRYFGEFKPVDANRPRPETRGTPVDLAAKLLSEQYAPKPASPNEEMEPLEIVLFDHSKVAFPAESRPERRARISAPPPMPTELA